jgi:UPF0716 protein FxsA
MPGRELADAALVLIGGTLLITPGFVTDVIGLVCVIPLTRPLARRALGRMISPRFQVVTPPFGATFQRPGPTTRGFGTGSDVVEGDVVDDS